MNGQNDIPHQTMVEIENYVAWELLAKAPMDPV